VTQEGISAVKSAGQLSISAGRFAKYNRTSDAKRHPPHFSPPAACTSASRSAASGTSCGSDRSTLPGGRVGQRTPCEVCDLSSLSCPLAVKCVKCAIRNYGNHLPLLLLAS
jgi:hypothetical protein